MVAVIFGASAYRHLKSPDERSKSIGVSKEFTIFLGAAEVAGALGVRAGVLTRADPGDAQKPIESKVFVWHTGFWRQKAEGWHYERMLILVNLVIAFSDGGKYVLMK